MHLLDRFPDNGGLDSFNSSPERKLVSEYYRIKQMRLDKEIGSAAQYLSIRMDEKGNFLPCFAAEAADNVRAIYEEIEELKAQESFLLGKIDDISARFPDIDIYELHRQKNVLIDKIKGLQLFPVELEAARQRFTVLEQQITEYTKIMTEEYPGHLDETLPLEEL